MHWLRCRIDDKTRTAAPRRPTRSRRRSTRSPPAPVGARLPATHASQITSEIVGVSDGTPGQVFPLRNAPVLKPQAGETLEVQDPESGDWARWELRDDFVGSTEFDRHFTLDLVSGEVEFGPAIRETDGGWTQYGSVPPKGAVLRFTRYRHGGGRTGNVTAGTLSRCSRARSPASTPSPTPRPPSAASTPSSSSTRASARRWRSAAATARSPRRTSSSWPARRARAWRARSASRRARAARCRCTSSRACTRPTASSSTTSWSPTRR